VRTRSTVTKRKQGGKHILFREGGSEKREKRTKTGFAEALCPRLGDSKGGRKKGKPAPTKTIEKNLEGGGTKCQKRFKKETLNTRTEWRRGGKEVATQRRKNVG